MGFIDFTNGEVLTADQMDLVMRQGIMRFADATARDTALSEVLAEGMMAYLDDTNEVLKYDGTSWIDISGDITGVTAGTALTGGGTSGNVTLDVDESALTIEQSQVTDLVSDLADKQDDVITTQGDIVIGDASGDPVRLPVGSADQVLTSDGTTVSFQDAGGGAAELYAAGTHTVSKPAGVYLVDFTSSATVDGSTNLSNGLNVLDSFTSLEVEGELATFTDETPGTGNDINASVFANNIFVIAGAGGYLATSPDGITWTSRTSSFGSSGIFGVAFNDNLFVAVGDPGKIATSSDGITWTQRSSPASNVLFSVAAGDGLYVAVGLNGEIVTSNDGINWGLQSTPTTSTLRAVTYGDGLYVVGGNNGIMTSTDGITWVERTAPFSVGKTVNFGNNTYIAADQNGQVISSPDGITWTARSTETTADIEGSNFANGFFTIVGQNQYIATSPDGITWTTIDIAGAQDYLTITAGGGVYIIGGKFGVLIRSTYGGFVALNQLPEAIQP